MAELIVKTPKTAEPQADYAIQIEAKHDTVSTATPAAATASTTTTRKPLIAEVAHVDEEGQKFDKHGIRIGRWEMEPCGTDCSNILVAWCFPCVSAAQISHRLGGSYVVVLVFWGIVYCLSILAATLVVPSSTMTVSYESVAGHVTVKSARDDERDLASVIVWNMVGAVCGIVWLIVNLYLRLSVRERFSIPGGCCGDCCCVFWCSWCSLTQLATHIKSYKTDSCDVFGCVDALPGYDDGEADTAASKQ